MFRIITEVRPAWVIGENVANFTKLAFTRTKVDLESKGYRVQPFVIPSSAVSAPTEEIGYSSLPTMIPTILHTEHKGSSRKRFVGSPEYRGSRMSEGLRTSLEDPIYLNPSFGELAMGFPIGWTDLSASETPSIQK